MLTGSRESLSRLASEIELFLEHNDMSQPGVHMHVGPPSVFTNELVLAESSRELILAGPVPDEPT
jgi:hypothetical protein